MDCPLAQRSGQRSVRTPFNAILPESQSPTVIIRPEQDQFRATKGEQNEVQTDHPMGELPPPSSL